MNNVHIKRTRSVLLTALLSITNAMTLVASQKQSFCERQTNPITLGLPSAATTPATATNTAATAALAAIAQTQSSSATSSITTARASSTHSESTMSEEQMKAFQAYCAQQDNIICQRASSKEKWSGKLGQTQQEIAEEIDSTVACLPKNIIEYIAQYSYEFRGICTATITGPRFNYLISLPDGSLASKDLDDVVKIWFPSADSKGQQTWTLSQKTPNALQITDLFSLFARAKERGAGMLFPGVFFGSEEYPGVIGIYSFVTNFKGEKDWALTQISTESRTRIRALIPFPDGSFASGDYDGTIKIWALATNSTGRKNWVCVNVHNPRTSNLFVPSNRSCMSTIYDAIANIFARITDSKKRKYWLDPQDTLRALTVLPDGSLAAGYADGTIKIWR